jgi:GNAT superfamily N-acetyltransferase
MSDRAAFDHAVYEKWAECFDVTVEALYRPGTELIAEEQFTGSGGVHIWHIGEHAFARMDPTCEPVVQRVLARLAAPAALTGDHLKAALAPAQIREIEDNLMLYLYPPDFRPVLAPPPFTIRKLSESDAAALDALKKGCAEQEVEEGEVSVEDEIGFGCFQDDRMVAIATGFRLTGFMDIGVLTHPDFRRKGLGKAVVSALCNGCIETDVIAQYRCMTTNTGSRNLARALNFHRYFTQQSIYLQDS